MAKVYGQTRIPRRGLRPQPKSIQQVSAEDAEGKASYGEASALCFLCELLFKNLRTRQELSSLVARRSHFPGACRRLPLAGRRGVKLRFDSGLTSYPTRLSVGGQK